MTTITVPDIGTIAITAARRRGLEVLLRCERDGRPARESNISDPDRGTVYWQTLRWLELEQLVTTRIEGGQLYIELSSRGRCVALHIDGGVR